MNLSHCNHRSLQLFTDSIAIGIVFWIDFGRCVHGNTLEEIMRCIPISILECIVVGSISIALHFPSNRVSSIYSAERLCSVLSKGTITIPCFFYCQKSPLGLSPLQTLQNMFQAPAYSYNTHVVWVFSFCFFCVENNGQFIKLKECFIHLLLITQQSSSTSNRDRKGILLSRDFTVCHWQVCYSHALSQKM